MDETVGPAGSAHSLRWLNTRCFIGISIRQTCLDWEHRSQLGHLTGFRLDCSFLSIYFFIDLPGSSSPPAIEWQKYHVFITSKIFNVQIISIE